MKLLLIRHGESEANAKGILAGRLSGVALSSQGKSQASILNTAINQLSRPCLYSSPIQRCLETARLAVASSSYDEILIDDDLAEVDYGNWSGKRLEDLEKLEEWSYLQKNAGSFKFPAGESFEEVSTRLQRYLESLVERHEEKATVVAFSHADIIKVLVTKALAVSISKIQRIRIDPASITEFELSTEGLSIVRVNQVISGPTKS
ncbi:MAG: hypothetical protein RIT32_913 [Actinomycetota bacterium]|jgi:probable phosphoglycerate mutase